MEDRSSIGRIFKVVLACVQRKDDIHSFGLDRVFLTTDFYVWAPGIVVRLCLRILWGTDNSVRRGNSSNVFKTLKKWVSKMRF